MELLPMKTQQAIIFAQLRGKEVPTMLLIRLLRWCGVSPRQFRRHISLSCPTISRLHFCYHIDHSDDICYLLRPDRNPKDRLCQRREHRSNLPEPP
ncbi:hypothetical protein J6590_034610 [Homalodisca vitripennis]|nr:hypothetical protein J6590_034610 [Homalodisca vitripennis]